MRLWLDGKPGFDDPPEELAEKAWRALAAPVAGELKLPIYSYAGLSVRIRFVYELPEGSTPTPDMPGPSVPLLASRWVHVLEGLLWETGGQIAELYARREWGRVAGVEVTV